MECPACKTPVDASQRFCPKCGALQPAAAEGAGADPLVGTVVGGKYRIVKLLGEGGMGAVYTGEQQLGTKTRRVAVKTLHPHLSKDPKVKARFQREVGTIAELEHPNTIQVYDFGTTDEGLLYLVMEFIDGTNVADVIEKTGPIESKRVEKIMAQVCGSLEEAHSRGIIHRDLKPENVVLTERAGQKDFVKVLDFGIAKRSHEEDQQEQKLTQQGMVLGTPPYMSPEQFTGKPIDARSDIYSLGVMMYEMLTGRLPFNANTAWEWATQHMTVPPIAMDQTPGGAHVPPRMRDAIMRALEKDPDRRWPTVRAFADAFAGTGEAGAAAPRPATAQAQAAGTPAPSDAMKGKTQIGEPMAPAAFGAPPAYGAPPGPMGAPNAPGSMGGPMGAQMSPHPAGTPSAGNQAVPMVPQAPPREQRGGNKGPLLAAIGLIGVLSVGAIAYAVMPHHANGGGGSGGLDLGADSGASSGGGVQPVTTVVDNTPPPPVDSTIAPLGGPTKNPSTPHPGTPTAHHDAGAAPTPKPSGGKPAAEPPACLEARALQANPNLNKDQALTNLFNRKRADCITAGGKL